MSLRRSAHTANCPTAKCPTAKSPGNRAGLAIFKPSCMYCVTSVRSAVAECRALKPCCVGDRGMCGVIVLRISLSRILTGFHNKEIGR